MLSLLDAHRLASQWSSNQQQLHSSLTSASPPKRCQQEQQVPPQQPTPQPQPQQQQQQQQEWLQQAQQLQEWLLELRCMESTAAASSLQIVHDPACSPQLLISNALAQQHPLWLADYASWLQQQQTQAELQQQLLAQQQQQQQQRVLHVLLPSVAQLDIAGSATLAVAPYYAAAVQSAPSILQLASSPSQQQPDTTSASHAADAAVQQKAASGYMPWPLTAAATAALLASPPGVLTEAQVQAVYGLGLGARLQALTAAVDLGQMMRLEAASTEVGAVVVGLRVFGCGADAVEVDGSRNGPAAALCQKHRMLVL
jgi:hypothetical protein